MSTLHTPQTPSKPPPLPTLAALDQALASGTTRATDLLQACLARAADPAGEGARVYMRRYDASARAAAQASDTLRAAGLARSPLEGLPISIKDLFDVAGEPTTAGSVVLADAPPARATATVVQRLRTAGAVIVGKTGMTEFAFSGLGINPHHGTPRNPWERDAAHGGRIPGGSSSGAAVSVTDGMAAAAIGSDTGGSVRIPAALCGLTGFKPTARRVPTEGALPLSTQLDSIGPLAPSVACCALLDAVMAGADPLLPHALPLAGLRLAVPTTVVLDGLDATVAAAWSRALTRLSAAGARLTELALPEFAQLAQINAMGGFSAAESWAWHRALIERAGERYDPRVLSRMRRGAAISAADWLDLVAARRAWVAAVEARVRGFDALLLPTVPVVAPTIAQLQASDEAYFAANGLILRNPSILNFLDGCALSLPCHAPDTAPVGLMIAAPALADARVLAIGLAVEALLAQG